MGVNEQMAAGLIRQQQEGMDEWEPAFCVGEQLLDMVAGDEHAAGILTKDQAIACRIIRAATGDKTF